MALDQLKAQQKTATLILITDGIESCDGDLCQTIAEARLSGIDFKLHIVGFGIKEETAALQCAADAGGGQYFDASDVDKLAAALQEATRTTVDNPSENLSIFATKNGQPVDAWIKVYPSDGEEAVAGGRTYRDTALLAVPAGRFKVDVRPLENTDIRGTSFEIALSAEEQLHRTVSFDAAKISVTTTVNGELTDGIARVYPADFSQPVANARTYGGTSPLTAVPPGRWCITSR
jgi:Ca-activated chloride channel family protein